MFTVLEFCEALLTVLLLTEEFFCCICSSLRFLNLVIDFNPGPTRASTTCITSEKKEKKTQSKQCVRKLFIKYLRDPNDDCYLEADAYIVSPIIRKHCIFLLCGVYAIESIQ